jgi:hypothetical protein
MTRRLSADDAKLNRMARGLSWRAPRPAEVLAPGRFTPPTPPPPTGGREADWLQWLEHWSAEDVRFEAGVPVACSLAGRAFVSLGDWLFRHAPITDVRLVAVAHLMDELVGCPWVAKLRALDLSGSGIPDADLDRLRGRFPGLVLLR